MLAPRRVRDEVPEVHRVAAAEALRALGSAPSGLRSEEARRRLLAVGPNRIERERPASALRRIARQLTHLLALVLWAAVALAFAADRWQPGSGMAALGWAIVGVILVNGAFSFLQEHRAGRAIVALRALVPERAKVVRDGGVVEIPAAELVPGDVVLLERGDRVPADCRLVSAAALLVNAAALTGESAPEPRHDGACAAGDLRRADNVVLAGTFVVGGHGRGVVFATGMRTAFGEVARLAQASPDPPAPLQVEVARLGRVVVVLAVAAGAACFGVGFALGAPLSANLLFAVGVIVANVPEGLLPTVTLALAMASQRMAGRHALVRRLAAVEALGSATVICTDKTGTLTENRMALARVHAGGETHDVAPATLAALARRHPRLFEGALLCNDVRETRWKGTTQLAGDPGEVALYGAALEALGHGAGARREDEVPFDWERRRVATVHRTARGRVLHVRGAPESVLAACTSFDAAGTDAPFGAAEREAVLAEAARMAADGLRVLAFATRRLAPGEPRAAWERDLVLAGLFALADPVRAGVPAAVARCREAGIRVVMITGDHPATAAAVAREAGLARAPRPRIVLGDELRAMDDARLAALLDTDEVLFARADPSDKLRIVLAFRARGDVVAVTGDGVNDAPALRAAHVGIAMGLSGTDVARDAADVVLADDDFSTIVSAVEEGRGVFDNLRKFLTYILTSNVPELVPYLAHALLRIPLGLTVLQILAVDLGTDMLPALALGAERPDRDVMQRPPRPRGQRLVDRALLLRAYAWLGAIEAAAAMTTFLAVLAASGWRRGELPAWADPGYRAATAACLVAIVVMQVANGLACRSERASSFARPLRQSPLLLLGFAVELALALALVHVPAAQLVFGTAPPPAWAWLVPLPFAAALVGAEEARKAWRRRPAPISRRGRPRDALSPRRLLSGRRGRDLEPRPGR